MPSYDFILGDASSGKSRYIYLSLSHEASLHPDRHYYLFVPEQNTLKVQRQIVELSERHGMLSLDVLSFELLFYRVLEELGETNIALRDAVTESLLIRKAALDADHAGELSLYHTKLGCRGFIEELRDIIREFSRYRIDEHAISTVIERTGDVQLRAKLCEILAVYTRYRGLLGEESTTSEEAPEILLSLIGRTHILDGGVVVFDGFTDFQPVQVEIIRAILEKAEKVSFVFTLPPSEDPFDFDAQDISDLWWLSHKSIASIVDAASRAGVRMASPAIRRIERDEPHREIIIHPAHDPTAEVRLVAERIRERALVRGTRYRQMALAVSDMGTYKEIIRREFSALGIPFFMDERARASSSPGVELIRAALSSLQSSYRYRELIRYLKNPLFAGNEEIDEYDLLARKRGLRGRKMALSLAGELGAERVAALLTPLFALDERLRTSSAYEDMSGATLAFMEEIDFQGRMESYGQKLLQAGLLQQAADSERFMTLIPEFIGRIAEVLGHASSSAEEYARLLEAGFMDLSGGVTPETMDMVVIGDMRRSRIEDIASLYVLGANEGLLPAPESRGGILSEYDRLCINRLARGLPQGERFEIAPDESTRSALQYFYLYVMTHKPDEELFISYSLSGRDGTRLWPSRVINDILERAPRVSCLIASPAAAPVGAMRLRPVKRTARLGADTALRLYTKRPEISVSRLESYASCPYGHFLSYGLRLREREEFDIEAVDLGNLYHDALNILWSFGPLTELGCEELDRAARSAAHRAIAEYRDQVMSLTQRNRFIASSLERTIVKTARAIRDQLRRGDFTTFDTELKFRQVQDDFVLTGKIDRVDVAHGQDRVYVNVIDYKSSARDFDETLMRAGIDLQLSCYMENALREVRMRTAERVDPGGMFFYHVSDPVIKYRETLSADPQTIRADRLRLKGVSVDSREYLSHIDSEAEGHVMDAVSMSTEDLCSLISSSSDLMLDITREIKRGDISIYPYRYKKKTGCDYCPYRGRCDFGSRRGDSYRWITRS